MTRLPVLIFAAGMAIWGLASIPDGSGPDQTSPGHRRGQPGGMSDKAFLAPTRKAATSALRAERPGSCGAAAGRECVRVSLTGRS